MDWGSALALMVLSPIVIIMDIACLFAISHYKNNYHGTDLTLIMVIVPMILNAIFTLPIPAILTLLDFSWTQELCSIYVWIFCTLRLAQILGLLCLSLQWVVFLRVKGDQQAKTTTLAMPWVVLATWILSGLVAIMPVGTVSPGTYFNSGERTCAFLSYEWGLGYAMFFAIIIFTVFCVSVVSMTDTALIIRHMKKVAVTKYRARRFHMPSTITTAYQHDKKTVQDRYSELNFASDLCRFVFIFVTLSSLISHLPYAGIQCVQLFWQPDRETMELVTLWLVLAECLVLPHTLWILSKRYRHGFVYFWKVHILKNTSAEEEPAACMLQSYVYKGSGANGTTRGVAHYQNRILRSLPRGTTADMIEETGEISQPSPARGGLDQVFPDQSNRKNGNITVHAQHDLEERPSTSKKGHPGTVSVKVYNANESFTNKKSIMSTQVSTIAISPPTSPVERFVNSQSDVQRTSSRSRQEWMDQMRRKHLPAIFVNDAFEKEDAAAVRPDLPLKESPAESSDKTHKKAGSNSSLYYLSGEYHPDNLTSSVIKQNTESESDATSNQYDTVDISGVLDESSSVTKAKFANEPPAGHSSASNSPRPPKKPMRKQQSIGKYSPQAVTEPDTISVQSDKSIVLTPYMEQRRPLWLDHASVSDSEITSGPSVNHVSKYVSTTSSQRSNSPSIHFDEDVDKGFEEALAIGYASVSDHETISGNLFESIQEEPEERLSRSLDSNPFSVEALEDSQSEAFFVTKAVVSKRQRNYSSDSENPFDKVPMTSFKPQVQNTNPDGHALNGNGDSGTGTWTDYSNGFIDADVQPDVDEVFSIPLTQSPSAPVWPNGEATYSRADDMSFDSDFSDAKLDELDPSLNNVLPNNFPDSTNSSLSKKITQNNNKVDQSKTFDPAYF